jgi:CheY-like chemotaxis protein
LPGKDLWPLKVDPSQMDQILANLCVNARDAIAGVGNITIKTQNATFDPAYCVNHPEFAAGEYVQVIISDNGCGMDKLTLAQIFEPFFTTKDIGEGTGLGMATVFGIVKQNNGIINVNSEPKQGTTISIYLPRYLGNTEQGRTERTVEFTADGHETILVVEDEPSVLSTTMKMLQHLGYTVIAAGSPDEAMRKIVEFNGEVHMILSDVVLPGMNGRDLVNWLLADYPNIKCLFMSGYTANIITKNGVLDEGVYFIQKPFLKKDLAAKVRQVLENGKS